MAGPNMEVFKFGFYMFFPVFVMFRFGDPQWYDAYVKPYKEIIWPPYESTHKPPKSSTELHEELARLKAERRARAGFASGQDSVVRPGSRVAEELAQRSLGSGEGLPAQPGNSLDPRGPMQLDSATGSGGRLV